MTDRLLLSEMRCPFPPFYGGVMLYQVEIASGVW